MICEVCTYFLLCFKSTIIKVFSEPVRQRPCLMNKQHNPACRYRNVRREHFETWPLNLEISYSVHGLKQNILRRALYETQALCPCEILVLSNLCCNCLLRNYTPVSRCNCLKLIQLIMKTSGTYKFKGLRKLVDVVLRSF